MARKAKSQRLRSKSPLHSSELMSPGFWDVGKREPPSSDKESSASNAFLPVSNITTASVIASFQTSSNGVNPLSSGIPQSSILPNSLSFTSNTHHTTTSSSACSSVPSVVSQWVKQPPSDMHAELKKRSSWEKFPMQKSKVMKSKSPRDHSASKEITLEKDRKDVKVGQTSPSGGTSSPGVEVERNVKSEHVSGKVSPRLHERCQLLDRWLKARPTWVEVFEKGKLMTKTKIKNRLSNSNNNSIACNKETNGEKNSKTTVEKEEYARENVKEAMRSSTDTLEKLLQCRPSWVELMERGIGRDEKKVQKKKEKCKKTLRCLLGKRKEKESQTVKGAGFLDSYFEIGRPTFSSKDIESDFSVASVSGIVFLLSCVLM